MTGEKIEFLEPSYKFTLFDFVTYENSLRNMFKIREFRKIIYKDLWEKKNFNFLDI